MEFTGLKRALASDSTGTYASVARSTTGWAPQFGSASEALTLDRMESSFVASREYSQVGDTYAIFLNKTLYKIKKDTVKSICFYEAFYISIPEKLCICFYIFLFHY